MGQSRNDLQLEHQFVLTSEKFGGATITTDRAGIITAATGEYHLFIGMAFKAFIKGMRDNDTTTRYQRT